MRRTGFTLIEVMIAVMLTGMVTALALAPVVVTVRRVVELQQDYSDASALSRALAFIGRDVAAALREAPVPLIVKDGRVLGGGDDDVLIVMSASPARQDVAAGSLVYRVERGSPMRQDLLPGLYRWVLSGKLPTEVDPDKLRGEEGQLVLPGVTGFRVEVPVDGEERRKEYKGPLPAGLFIALTRGTGKEEESAEDFAVFP